MGFVPDSQGASPNSTPSSECWECKKCWSSRLSHSKGEDHDLASVTSAPQLFTAKLQLRHNRCHNRILIVLYDYSSKGRVPPFLGWCMRIYSELMGVCNTKENTLAPVDCYQIDIILIKTVMRSRIQGKKKKIRHTLFEHRFP